VNYHGAVLREQFLFGLVAAAANSGQAQRAVDQCDHNTALPYGKPLEIKMRVLDGPDFVLSKYDGHAVWINLFATWCEPCVKEQPFIVRAAKDRYDAGLRVIGINFRELDDAVRAYRAKYDISYPIAMDQSGGFTYALETGTTRETVHFPAHLFITPTGVLDCYVIGSMSDDEITHKLDAISASVPTPRPASTNRKMR
jgi:thiol-disulfide isomerase/thioredoxin